MTMSGTNLISTGLPETSTVPSPMVNQASAARIANSVIAVQYFRSRTELERVNFPIFKPPSHPLAISRALQTSKPGSQFTVPSAPASTVHSPLRQLIPDPLKPDPCNGAQGRIRTSVARKERQIYSLLPLTARPPVPNSSGAHPRGVFVFAARVRDQIIHPTNSPPHLRPRTPQPPVNFPDHRSMQLSGIAAELKPGAR